VSVFFVTQNAVVDSAGKVHGVTGLYVADASIFPIKVHNHPAKLVGSKVPPGMSSQWLCPLLL
jgi:hypothetical protein